MAVVNVLGERFVLVREHPATHKKWFLRRAPWFAVPGGLVGTPAQLRARLELAEFAYNNLYGKKGTVTLPDGRRIPATAYEVMTKYPYKGVGVFGGKSKEERASERHAMAAETIRKLREAIGKAGYERYTAPELGLPTF